MSIFLIIIILPFSSTNADVVRFFPENCLGGWENPQNASGIPNVDDEVTFFDKTSSAFLDNSNSEIFCGGFNGDDSVEKILPQKFVVKFSWLITDSPVIETEKDILENNQPIEIINNESPSENTQDNQNIIDESILQTEEPVTEEPVTEEPVTEEPVTEEPVTEEPVTEEPATEEPATEEPIIEESTPTPITEEPITMNNNILDYNSSKFLFSDITTKAFAQEEVIENIPVEPVQPDQPLIEEDIIDIPQDIENSTNEIINKDVNTDEELSNDDGTNIDVNNDLSNTEVIDENISTDETENEMNIGEVLSAEHTDNFLEVSYSMNGSDWNTLGFVNKNNWQNAEFEIPFDRIATWNNISNLQIKVKNLPTIDKQPYVYIDGMSLEVSYIELQKEEPLEVVDTEEEDPIIFSKNALQSCSINPFSKIIKVGDTTNFEVNLTPNDINKPYKISFGKAPKGIDLSIPDTLPTLPIFPSEPISLLVSARPNAQLGSFNLVLIYTEENEEEISVPNFCQFNIEVIE